MRGGARWRAGWRSDVLAPLSGSLERISHAARRQDATAGEAAVREALAQARSAAGQAADAGTRQLLERLQGELGVWQEKWAIIWKEAAGRQGMARHAEYWVELLKKAG
jgi:hypothetical protein